MSAFRLEDLDPEARRARLEPGKGQALSRALEQASRPPRPARPEPVLRDFLLPFAEFGLDEARMLALLDQVPDGWSLSHREMYYDFRLARWQKHVEPPTIAESLEEYLEHAPSREAGLAYLRGQWREFLRRHGAV